MVAPLYTTASGLLFHAGKILVVTVGLPARGKTHISRALERYLRWAGIKTQVVSLGDYRRKTLGGAQKLPPDYFTLGAWSIDHCLCAPVLRRRPKGRNALIPSNCARAFSMAANSSSGIFLMPGGSALSTTPTTGAVNNDTGWQRSLARRVYTL
jgi:6-phosphofructo-2-kinase